MMLLWLFIEFFKTGLFALGGGLATLPFLYNIAENYGWFSKGDIVNMLAISQSTPGAIGVNMSTYSGFQAGGVIGGLVGTFGLVLPSIIICVCVSKVLDRFKENKTVQKGFYGIRPVVAGLILAATMEVFRVAFFKDNPTSFHDIIEKIDFSSVILFGILFLGNLGLEKKGKPIHPILLIVISGCIGVFVMGV